MTSNMRTRINAVVRLGQRNDRMRDAAPEMYELLKSVRETVKMVWLVEYEDVYRKCDAIIAKVEGHSEESDNGTATG